MLSFFEPDHLLRSNYMYNISPKEVKKQKEATKEMRRKAIGRRGNPYDNFHHHLKLIDDLERHFLFSFASCYYFAFEFVCVTRG